MTEWLTNFQRLVTEAGLPWIEPHTCTCYQGIVQEISHEWWDGNKTIVAFEYKTTTYEDVDLNDRGELLKVWGPNIHTQMESIALDDDVKLVEAWKWIFEKNDPLCVP